MTSWHDGTAPCDCETLYSCLREIDRSLIHDVNSLLSGLGLALEMIDGATRAALGADDREALRLAERNARCMRELVADYVELHRCIERLGSIVLHPFEVSEMLRDATTTADVRDRAVIRIEHTSRLPAASGDRVLMGLTLAALLKTLPPVDAPDAIVIAARHANAAIEVTVHAEDPPTEFGLAGARPRPPSKFVRQLFHTAVERQGGTATFPEPPAAGPLASFTLPAVPRR